ncbi:MAG: O-antigen ligase family protein [Eubacteriales bacterium]
MKERLQPGLQKGMGILITTYVTLLFVVYPLYYQNKYFNMGEAKYEFVKYVSLVFFGMMCAMFLFLLAIQRRRGCKALSPTDWCAVAYTVVLVLSYIHSPYKETILWGYDGWYMGIMSQLLFVLIYFFVSRYMKYHMAMGYGMLVTASMTHLFAILHRFSIDPLGMYEGVSESYYILFLSTVGQATWYSSYLCVVFPIGIAWYCLSPKPRERIALGFYLVLGSASLVTQNSDSAFFSLAFVLLVVVLASIQTKVQLLRLLEVLFLIGSAFVGIGILQILFPEQAVALDSLSIFCSQSMVTKVLLGSVIILYLVVRYVIVEGSGLQGDELCWNARKLRSIVLLSVVGIILLIGMFMWLVTTGQLPQQLAVLEDIGYLNFNHEWGSSRGFSWTVSAHIWKDYPISYQLLGCGPDGFADYAYEHHYDEITQLWDDIILTNTHNEWFTSLLFTGILGFISYAGMFISQIVRGARYMVKEPIFMCGVVCVVSYMAHNFFCYQQIVCTPLIFIVLGAMEHGMRADCCTDI